MRINPYPGTPCSGARSPHPTAPNGRSAAAGCRAGSGLARADPGSAPDLPDGGFDDDTGIFATIFLAIFAVIAAIFLVLVLFNVVAIAIELMIFIVALFAGLFSRVVLRRPWTVFAKSERMTHVAPRGRLAREPARSSTRWPRRLRQGSSPRRGTGDDWMIDVVVWP